MHLRVIVVLSLFIRNVLIILNILATSEGSIPMFDGEQLLIIEQDQGDGWTRVRRQPPNAEEGFVPTSYISIHSS